MRATAIIKVKNIITITERNMGEEGKRNFKETDQVKENEA